VISWQKNWDKKLTGFLRENKRLKIVNPLWALDSINAKEKKHEAQYFIKKPSGVTAQP
jgi:hypothetical protein